jgi:hypothetical protein
MVEVLSNLPTELKNKVFSYTSHPVADLFREEFLPGMTACTKCMEDLQEYFPQLTRSDMHVLAKGSDQPAMGLLHLALFEDEHRVVAFYCLLKWKEALHEQGEQVCPHWFFEFYTQFMMQHSEKWKSMPVLEFYEWVKEHCSFEYLEDED